MQNSFAGTINKAIAYSYYALFFLVPLIMHPHTYELFEFNKMWITFGFALLIGFLWIVKTIVTGKFVLQRTILDIPILLFVVSQILSTIFSMDPHTSFWGYYSRFNGGLLSLFCYVFLYYGFATHLATREEAVQNYSFRLILVSLFSGAAVALWGLPSHFGADPTCLVFRGSLDVSCWTESFQPTLRIFSTLGQPNWLAAYLAVLLPIVLSLPTSFFTKSSSQKRSPHYVLLAGFLGLAVLFYIDILFTRSQSGFIATWIGLIVFGILAGYKIWLQKDEEITKFIKTPFTKFLGATAIFFILFTFLIGTPIGALERLTLPGLQKNTAQIGQNGSTKPAVEAPQATGELGGTDSGKIRLIVWQGALDIFKNNPILGSGVETFAYAYYKVKPVEHNLTSEWDFLYNKAHNEYLNYLATTGILGLGTYLLFIGWFLSSVIRRILLNKNLNHYFLCVALVGGFVSILISNFFGFSVVIVNLFLFLIPIFVYDLAGFGIQRPFELIFARPAPAVSKGKEIQPEQGISGIQVFTIIVVGIAFLYFVLVLFRYWIADQRYALGYNLNKYAGVQGYIDAQKPLLEAVEIRPTENLYKNELSVNLATIALVALEQKQATQASQFAKRAVELSNEVVSENPNNVVYFKTRTRVFYALSQLDPTYFQEALRSIEKSEELAPTDAKILYNKALLYGQAGERMKAIDVLTKTVELKPNYIDAYQARALMYNQEADEVVKTNTTAASELRTKARGDLQYILDKLDPGNKTIKDLLKTIQ